MGSQAPVLPINNFHNDGRHYYPYPLGKFMGIGQLPQSTADGPKLGIEKFQPGVWEQYGKREDETVESKSTYHTLLPNTGQTEKTIEVHPEVEVPCVRNDNIPHWTKAAIPFLNDTSANGWDWQYIDSEGSIRQVNCSGSSEGSHPRWPAGVPIDDFESQSFVPDFGMANYRRGNEGPLATLDDVASRSVGLHHNQTAPGVNVLFSNAHDLDNEASAFPTPDQTTTCSSISPISSTVSRWSGYSPAGPRPLPPTKLSYHVPSAIAESDTKQGASMLDAPYHGHAFPAAVTGEWYAPECPYQCCSDASFSTMTASHCGTPDPSFALSDSTIGSDTASIQYAQLHPEVKQSRVGQLPFRSISEPATNAPMTIVPCDNQGTRRFGGKVSSQHIELKDAFLINCKQNGMSYKEIKEKGQFAEAESTLRGRYRTLTKRKEHRVRKPGWHDRDLRLLCEAVAKLADISRYTTREEMKTPRVSWKQVAEYIWENGGSYHFGNATCKKKWEELRRQSSYVVANT